MERNPIEKALQEQTFVLSKFLSDPTKKVNYEYLQAYLTDYCFFLSELNQKVSISVTITKSCCSICNSIYESSKTPTKVTLNCCNHSFCKLECARTFIEIFTEGEILNWSRLVCPECRTPISKMFMEKVFNPENFDEIILKAKSDKEPKFVCDICQTEFKINESITLNCNHRFCKPCMSLYLEAKINEAQVSDDKLVCPNDNDVPIDPNIVHACVSQESFEKFQKFSLNQWEPQLDQGEIYYRCNGVDCGYAIVLDGALDEYECGKCHIKFCPKCSETTHKGTTCESFKKWKEENDKGDEMFQALLKNSQWIACPWCKQVIERVSGCKYMVCSSMICRSKKYFCFDCKQGLGHDHAPHACVTP